MVLSGRLVVCSIRGAVHPLGGLRGSILVVGKLGRIVISRGAWFCATCVEILSLCRPTDEFSRDRRINVRCRSSSL